MRSLALGALPLAVLLACAGETPPSSPTAQGTSTPPLDPALEAAAVADAAMVEAEDAAVAENAAMAAEVQAEADAVQEMEDAAVTQQELAQAMMAAQADAELPDPGPDGFLTTEEEEGLRSYLEQLQTLGEQLDMQAAAMGQLDEEGMQAIQDGMAQMRALQPPAIANEGANETVQLFHSLTSEMSSALSALLEQMPQGEPTPEQQQAMMPHIMEFQQKMQGLAPQMMTASMRMAQIVSTDLGSEEAFAQMLQ